MNTSESGISIHGSFEDSYKYLSKLKLNTWNKVECKGMNTGKDDGRILFILDDLKKDATI
jgi:hypothetical protein